MQAFKWLLFDADNTLLDFTSASKIAFHQTLSAHGFKSDDRLYALYKNINDEVWRSFEKGKLKSSNLRKLRFQLLFEAMGVAPPPLKQVSADYLQQLVLVSQIYPGVYELLEQLSGQFLLSIVTNGLKEVQRPRLDRLQLMPFFDSIVVSDEIGVAKPDPAYFDHVFNSIQKAPDKNEVLIIGDNLSSDILGGINYGIRTCWVSHNRKNESKVKPDFIIPHVQALPALLKSLESA